MMNISLLPLDDGRIINLNQIVEVERFDTIQIENDDGKSENLINGAIVKMHNGSEVILDEINAEHLFAFAFEQLDLLENLKSKMGIA
jgi:hypothetical protein